MPKNSQKNTTLNFESYMMKHLARVLNSCVDNNFSFVILPDCLPHTHNIHFCYTSVS